VAKKMTKAEAETAEMLTIPTFLNRAINPHKVAVGYQIVDGELFKVDGDGNLFNAKTNKLKRAKKRG